MLKLLNYKNPKITEKNINFRNWALSQKSYLRIRIYFGKKSPFFKCDKDFNSQHIKVEGGLILEPICELPKFGFLKNFYFYESNRMDLSVSTKTDINLDAYNNLYKTSYSFKNAERKKIFGFFKPIPERNRLGDWLYGNFISINNSYENYINSLYEFLRDGTKPFVINAIVQKIDEWESWPVIGMALDSDYSEIIKDEYFDFANNIYEMPYESDILFKK